MGQTNHLSKKVTIGLEALLATLHKMSFTS